MDPYYWDLPQVQLSTRTVHRPILAQPRVAPDFSWESCVLTGDSWSSISHLTPPSDHPQVSNNQSSCSPSSVWDIGRLGCYSSNRPPTSITHFPFHKLAVSSIRPPPPKAEETKVESRSLFSTTSPEVQSQDRQLPLLRRLKPNCLDSEELYY